MSEESDKVDNGFVEFEREPKLSGNLPATGDYAEKATPNDAPTQNALEENGEAATAPLEENKDEENADAPKDAQAENKARRPKTLVLIGVVGGLMALGALAAMWSQQVALGEFVITGNRLTRAEAITERINFMLGKAMREVSLAEIEDTLCAMPLIKKVIATKEFPSAIHLKIVERRFVAFAMVGGRLKVVGDDGVLADAEPEFLGKMRLPWLSGFEKTRRNRQGFLALDSAETACALDLLAALGQRDLCKMMIAEVRVSPKELTAFSNEAETRFMFGCDGNYERKLDRLEAFWKQVIVKKSAQRFEYVDLRYDKCVFAKSVQNLKSNFDNKRQ